MAADLQVLGSSGTVRGRLSLGVLGSQGLTSLEPKLPSGAADSAGTEAHMVPQPCQCIPGAQGLSDKSSAEEEGRRAAFSGRVVMLLAIGQQGHSTEPRSLSPSLPLLTLGRSTLGLL